MENQGTTSFGEQGYWRKTCPDTHLINTLHIKCWDIITLILNSIPSDLMSHRNNSRNKILEINRSWSFMLNPALTQEFLNCLTFCFILRQAAPTYVIMWMLPVCPKEICQCLFISVIAEDLDSLPLQMQKKKKCIL